MQQSLHQQTQKTKNQKVLEALEEGDDELDFYENATNDRMYNEPDCKALQNKTYLGMQTDF